MMQKFTLAGILVLLLAGGCLDRIDIPIPMNFRESIVIDGKIVLDHQPFLQVQVGQLFSFSSSSRGSISTKDAILMDADGNTMTIRPTGTGLFYYEFKEDDPIKIAVGKSYSLSIGLFDGRAFESSFEVLEAVPPIGQIGMELSTQQVVVSNLETRVDTFMSYNLSGDIRPEPTSNKSFLKWEFERFARITDNPPLAYNTDQKVCYIYSLVGALTTHVFAGPRQSADRLENYTILTDQVSRFYGEGQYFTVFQESLSEGAYNYWENVRQVSEEVGDIFGPLPGKIKSNFTSTTNPDDEVFGYFYATQRDSIMFYIDPMDIFGRTSSPACPVPVTLNPDGTCPDKLCCDCLSETGSTTSKPSFWVAD